MQAALGPWQSLTWLAGVSELSIGPVGINANKDKNKWYKLKNKNKIKLLEHSWNLHIHIGNMLHILCYIYIYMIYGIYVISL